MQLPMLGQPVGKYPTTLKWNYKELKGIITRTRFVFAFRGNNRLELSV